MARNFNGLTNYLTHSAGAGTASLINTYAISLWFYPEILTALSTLYYRGQRAGSNQFSRYIKIGINITNNIYIEANWSDGITVESGVATSTTTITQNAWNHVLAYQPSSSYRAIWLNGAGKGTNSTNVTSADNYERSNIATRQTGIGTFIELFDGSIAEIAEWDEGFVLIDSDYESIAKSLYESAIVPTRFLPSELRRYIPLLTSEDSSFGIQSFKFTSTSLPSIGIEHPRIIYPVGDGRNELVSNAGWDQLSISEQEEYFEEAVSING